MRPSFLPLAASVAALSLGACAPKALYFHESTKVAFAADYNSSDSQPLSSSFGYKRRIVAVVPAQKRNIPDGATERKATNSGEALSLVSKFNVRADSKDGVVITNNFASGMAARIMTRSVGSPDSLNVLMHSAPIAVSPSTGKEESTGRPAAEVVNDRLARIMGKRARPSEVRGDAFEYEKDPVTRKLKRKTPDTNIENPKLPEDVIEYEKDPVTGKLRPKTSGSPGHKRPGRLAAK